MLRCAQHDMSVVGMLKHFHVPYALLRSLRLGIGLGAAPSVASDVAAAVCLPKHGGCKVLSSRLPSPPNPLSRKRERGSRTHTAAESPLSPRGEGQGVRAEKRLCISPVCPNGNVATNLGLLI